MNTWLGVLRCNLYCSMCPKYLEYISLQYSYMKLYRIPKIGFFLILKKQVTCVRKLCM